MRHQKTRHKLSRDASHRKALLANLCVEVIDHERIKTTEAKAKAVKPELEKLITLAKKGDLHARRQAISTLQHPDKCVIYKLFEEIAPRYSDRPGGYTRILKLGPRLGDATEMVLPRARLTARLTLAYDGTPFAGWAAQPGKRTVQGELERALATVLRAEVPLTVAGRTDTRRARARAGRLLRRPAAVAALGQRGAAGRDRRAVRRGGARRLLRPPRRALAQLPSTACWRARRHRRSSATARCGGRYPLDVEALRACAEALVGTHDFTAFTPTETTMCASSARSSPLLGGGRGRARVPDRGRHVHAPHEPRARRDDARGRWRAAVARRLRGPPARRPRSAAGPTAPAHGLYLVSVRYD